MIKINRVEFVAALTEVKRIKVPRKPITPILKNVYLYAQDDHLHLFNSDGENSINYKIGTVNDPVNFRAAVNLTELDKIARKFKSDMLSISLEGDQVVISNNSTSIKLKNNVSAYPKTPNTPKELLLELKHDQFVKLFKNGLYAVSKQESRPILTGFNLISTGVTLEVNSTDSHRLVQSKLDFNGPQDLNITVKSDFIDTILKSKLKNDFKMFTDDHLIMLQAGPVTYHSKLMEGTYPAVNRLIPTDHSTRLIMEDLGGVIDALDLAKISLDKEDRPYIIMELIEGKGTMTTRKNDFEHIIKGSYTLDDLTIYFNPQYMTDILKQLDLKKPAILEFTSPLRPFTITQENDNTTHLLTPIRDR